jgi:hypothetical protein
MPEPQLICTVKPHRIAHAETQRCDARRVHLSASTLTQPRMTWSKASGLNG